MPNRIVSVSISEGIADFIETTTQKTIEAVTEELLLQFVEDGRRRKVPLVELAISWPLDWYTAMLAEWGENHIGANVRRVLYAQLKRHESLDERILTNPKDLEMADRERKLVKNRKPRRRVDGQSFIAQTLIPLDWKDFLQEQYGERKSTYVKAVMLPVIAAFPSMRKDPSSPKGLLKFMSEKM